MFIMNNEIQFIEAYKEAIKPVYKHYSVFYEHGNLSKIIINQSMMTEMYHTSRDFIGEEKEFCPAKIKACYIQGLGLVSSIYMTRGMYFEEHVIMPEKDRKTEVPLTSTGKIPVTLKRINSQIQMFDTVINKYGIVIHPEYKNCQIEKTVEVDSFDGVKAFVKMKYDIISPVNDNGITYDEAVIDLKLTGDLKYGYWARSSSIDITQALIYSITTKLPFFYLIFDYSPELRHDLKRVITPYGYKPDEKTEAKVREVEIKELIRKTIIKIIEFEEHGYAYNPSETNCKNCPLNPDFGGTCVNANRLNIL